MKDFINLDHAGWVQQYLDYMHKNQPKTYANAPEKLSEFQRRVFNIVGTVAGSLTGRTSPIAMHLIDWHNDTSLSFTWKGELATFDNDKLTLLVFLCHEARIRCQLDSTGPKGVKVSFWQRKAKGEGSIRHPNLNEAVKEFRKWFKPSNPIVYREEHEATTPALHSDSETIG